MASGGDPPAWTLRAEKMEVESERALCCWPCSCLRAGAREFRYSGRLLSRPLCFFSFERLPQKPRQVFLPASLHETPPRRLEVIRFLSPLHSELLKRWLGSSSQGNNEFLILDVVLQFSSWWLELKQALHFFGRFLQNACKKN